MIDFYKYKNGDGVYTRKGNTIKIWCTPFNETEEERRYMIRVDWDSYEPKVFKRWFRDILIFLFKYNDKRPIIFRPEKLESEYQLQNIGHAYYYKSKVFYEIEYFFPRRGWKKFSGYFHLK